jgi:hypothetical protein
MTISDVLTLLGILIAIFAFISEKSRQFILLKLSKTNILFICIAFALIHMLISYEWWLEKITILKKLEFTGYPTTGAWAYIISFCLLSMVIWRIFYGSFPLSRREKLLKYYNKLILRNDIPFLVQLIEDNHLKQILGYLRVVKSIKVPNPTGHWHIDNPKYLKIFNQVTNTKPNLYGKSVYHQIILNDAFLENIANKNPYLFASIIQELSTDKVKDSYFVNSFLKILMYNKNGDFFREIKNNQNLREHDSYAIEESRPILYALFNDINVCAVNEAWRGVGEQAIQELHEEAKKEYSSLRELDREQDGDTLWSYRITIAIWYFDIMIREAIVQNIENHMWMFYYQHFISGILKNMEKLPHEDSKQNRNTKNFDLIQRIFTNMMDWKKVIVSSTNSKLLQPFYSCFGLCIFELATTSKLRKEDKNELIDWIWMDLIETYGENDEQNRIVEEIIDLGFNMFKKPTILFSPNITTGKFDKNESLYLNALKELWEKRDIPKITGAIREKRANRFKSEIFEILLA